MQRSIAGRRVAVSIVGVLFLTLAVIASSCGGNHLEGTYHQTGGGPMTLDFKGNTVTVTMMGEPKTLDYKVDGDTITIINLKKGTSCSPEMRTAH